ncbi:hypothetical protein [Polymorphospora rubra]|uniref:Uncharacterized protein n=1 Tax=Polymorphospora rubra TaxID=338584 RepID=A0A810MRE4_9ACTN|nr:hypothetical protein [Polymorphospora rubra]BCJ63030.1 hypothetical protein Prubr_00510 [Polymorphospora rubra]
MARRWIKLELPDDLPTSKYADIGHAIYFLARAGLPDGDFQLITDDIDSPETLNARYERHAQADPWIR